MAHDDPEGWDYYNRTVTYAAGDPEVYILSNLNNIGSVEVNAFQVHSDAVVQKSTKEGFGLTVTEALWKTRPVVASRVGGIVAQIEDGETGWLVDPNVPEECASACIEILNDPAAAPRNAVVPVALVRHGAAVGNDDQPATIRHARRHPTPDRHRETVTKRRRPP